MENLEARVRYHGSEELRLCKPDQGKTKVNKGYKKQRKEEEKHKSKVKMKH